MLEPQPDHEWRVIRHWGSDGEDYQFSYDLEKGETFVVDSLGRTDHYFWGPLYEVYKHIDPLGHCWQDDMLAGQLLKTTDPQGGAWHYAYDEIGRLIETRDPLGRSDGKPGHEEVFYFHTNLAGLPEQLTDEHGLSVWHSEFQAWGNSRDEWHHPQQGQEQNLRFQGQYPPTSA